MRRISQLLNELLDLLPGRVLQCFRAAEIDSVSLHQLRIELVLANDLAEAIPHLVTRTITGFVRAPRRNLQGRRSRL